MKDVIIIGAGLFGSIAARLADRKGHDVTVLDCGEPWAASKASGCVLAPSWVSSLTSEQVTTAGEVLAGLAPVEPLLFKTNMLKSFKANRIDPRKILVKPDLTERVVSVGDGVVQLEGGHKLKGIVLVAAGIASSSLVEMPKVKGLWGASLTFKTQITDPRIHVYAPYRQAVAFNMDAKTVWMGDGTALVEKTWAKSSEEYLYATVSRAEKLFKLRDPVKIAAGARPYVEGHKAGYFARVHPKTWVSTGGAKNGTVLAAYQAAQFILEAKL